MVWEHQIETRWRNVLTDPTTKDAARTTNADDGFAPIVRVGSAALANPSWAELAPFVGRSPDELPRPVPRRPYASAGACGPPAPDTPLRVDAIRWAVIAAVSVLSFQAGYRGHTVLALPLATVTFWGWTLTRPRTPPRTQHGTRR